MGAAVARGSGTDTVFSQTGSGRGCRQPVITSTAACSSDVFINGVGVVRIGDLVAPHLRAGCVPDTSRLSSASVSVFANGRGVGRIGDEYTPDNIISSGSPTVFAGN